MIGESVRVPTLEFSPQVSVGVQASGWITGYEEAIPRDSRHYSGLPTTLKLRRASIQKRFSSSRKVQSTM
jgi:hypothetical protein